LIEDEPKYTEYICSVKQLLKVSNDLFAVIVQAEQSSLVLICTINGLAIKEYSMYQSKIEYFWMSNSDNEGKVYLNGLNSNSDICTLELSLCDKIEVTKKEKKVKIAEQEGEENVTGKINWELGNNWDDETEEDFFQTYKNRHTKPIKLDNIFYEKSHLMPN